MKGFRSIAVLSSAALLIATGALATAATATPATRASASRGTDARTVTGIFAFRAQLDPQVAWNNQKTNVIYDSYLPLLTYRRANGRAGSQVIPGLARSMPRITDGGRTYTLRMRSGLRYSDGEPVRAGDFKFSVERLFRLGTRDGFIGAEHFFDDIVGAAKLERIGRGGIPGIVADDRTGKIVIHLRRPDRSLTRKLAMTWTAPVPRGTAIRDLSLDPPPATGPYVISRSTREGWIYRRNPEWAGRNARSIAGVPAGHLGAIRIEVVRDTRRALRDVERGRADWVSRELSASLFRHLRVSHPARVRLEPTLGTEYFWLDTAKAPFDDPRVRRAVDYAVDRRVLRGLSGGQLAPSSQILPPTIPGYRRLDLYPHDLAKARRLIAAADPPRGPLTVWTYVYPGYPDAVAEGRYLAKVLRLLGFAAHAKVLGIGRFYATITDPERPHLDAGIGGYFANLPDADDFFSETLARPVDPYYNENLARFERPGLERVVERLNAGARAGVPRGGYAALDRTYTELAPWVPFGNNRIPLFVSDRIDPGAVVSNPTFGVDLTSLRLKRPRR